MATGPIRAEEIRPEKVEWLWRERIARGTLTVVAGRPDQGKGLFAVHVGAELSRRGHRILHSAIEDSHSLMTRPRYEAAGANLKNVVLWRFMLPAQMDALERVVVDRGIDLLVIDPVAAHLSKGVSRHSDSIRDMLNPLSELAEATGMAVLFVDHALKKVRKGGHPLDAIGGSGSGLPAACRMAFIFGDDPNTDDGRVLCHAKANLRDKPPAIRFETDVEDIEILDPKTGEVHDVPFPFLVFDDEIEFDAMQLFDTSKETNVGRPADKRAAAAEWLTNYLAAAAGRPVKSTTVFEDGKHYGLTTKTLRRAATDMGVLRDPPGGGRNCTWELPPEILELMGIANENQTESVIEPDEPVGFGGELVSDEDIAEPLGGGDE